MDSPFRFLLAALAEVAGARLRQPAAVECEVWNRTRSGAVLFQGREIELDPVARPLGRGRIAVDDPERLGLEALEPEPVHFQERLVRDRGEQVEPVRGRWRPGHEGQEGDGENEE